MLKKILGWLVVASAILIAPGYTMSTTKTNTSTIVILLGPPGAGKGTHAAPLSQHLSLPHISTGDLFRENMRNHTALGENAKSFIDQGKLVPDEVVIDMLFDRLKAPDCAKGCILDGFPRTLAQAKVLDERIGNQAKIIAINFSVPDEALIERITGRLSCKQCKKPYHKTFDPPKQMGICDVCGGELITRDDDQESIVRGRLEVYHKESQPLIEYYAKKPGVLHEIDSQKPKDQVFSEVLLAVSTINNEKDGI